MTDAAMVALVGRLRDDFDDIAAEAVGRYRGDIVDYAASSGTFIEKEVLAVTYHALKDILDNLEADTAPNAEQVERMQRLLARRVHQGVSLQSVQEACRLFGELFYARLRAYASLDVPAEREAVIHGAGVIMRHVHMMISMVTTAYLDELEDVRGDRDIVRRDLLEAVLAGRAASPATMRDARIVGIDLRPENVVIVARAPQRGDESADRPRTLLKAAKILRQRLLNESGGAFVGLREGEVVCLCPAPRPVDLEGIKAEANATAVMLGEFNMAVGVGTWHALPEEIPAAYAEAREAAEIAVRTGIRHRAVAYDDVLIDHVLRSSEHASRVVTSALGPLRDYDERREAGLVETLRAYIDTNFSIAGAARALEVHNNTIIYRLGRIRELTGRDPRNVDDVIFLALGLRLDAEG